MRLSAPLSTPTSWLAPLKAAQLQHIARATGIPSSGPKAALAQRIAADLTTATPDPRPWSILSIDMGIRNLAFAHLRVDRAGGSARATLAAWRRQPVSKIAGLDLEGADGFVPQAYAAAAYELVTALLAAYRPTHVLIERQRFRSNGGSAVQEWTLRVGVLEGMVYAVLHALRRERGGEVAGPLVYGVEPRRVVGYWEELGASRKAEEGEGRKKRVSVREVKKAKIDLVGSWLESEVMGVSEGTGKIALTEDAAVQELAGAYVRKWRGQRGGDLGKLDDLADCLLQGLTWLEWQVMRERLASEGVRALESMP
ncbi:mitochondrial resolvase Ydc2 [Penicillium macrosclerotiorum]|uniref:mitochondrial resolvase Ydc2 n=1 Tax=Penicillium macrosclerotiorum TaxID=303699 RepID=UPI002548FDC6|nr:mitochondrial resolvase Ydc2 [Penicillium macrosclerotiorum]KAJ5673854.1 mitochondrial resolvase Ydc2 [Penicillium macrosclerotiorum]